MEPGDVDALAKRLEQLLADSALRERMGKAGVEFVQQFTPEKIAIQWEELYSSLL